MRTTHNICFRLLTLIFSCVFFEMLGQTITKEYRYIERGPSDDIQFVFKGPDSLRLHSFQLSSGKTMERLGFIQSDTFMMTSLRFKKRITLRKLNEDSLTLLSIRKRNKYDLDVHGRHYDWVRVKSGQWKYLSNGKPVLEARVDRAEGYHNMTVSSLDPNLGDNAVLEIASAHVAVGKIGKKSNAWMVVALVAVTGILLRPVIQNNF
jgi:hypothetical protein